MQRGIASLVLLMVLSAFQAVAQNPRLSFDVASIKPAAPGVAGTSVGWPPGRFVATNVTVNDLLIFAYSPSNGPTLQKERFIRGPDWMNTARFDIQAKTPSVERKETIQLMMRSLLEDRFQLKLHSASQELQIYNLVVAGGGLKMKASENQNPSNSSPATSPAAGRNVRGAPQPGSYGMSSDSSGTTLSGTAVPMTALVSLLNGQAGRPVVDKTDLKGLFDFRLQFSPTILDAGAGPNESLRPAAPSLFTAIQEQLGLKLESARGPGEVFVIDHLEKPSEN